MIAPLYEIIAVLVVYAFVFVFVERLQRKKLIHGEISRKLTHIVGGFVAALLPLVLPRWYVIGLMLMTAAAMLVEKKFQFFKSIHSILRHTHGEVLFPLGIALVVLIEPQAWRITYGILVMGVSDALASVVGIRYGKKRYTTLDGHWKTYLGSLTFFVCTLGIGVAGLMIGEGYTLLSSLWPAAIVAAVLTIVEAGSSYGIDNLLIPTVAALGMQAIL